MILKNHKNKYERNSFIGYKKIYLLILLKEYVTEIKSAIFFKNINKFRIRIKYSVYNLSNQKMYTALYI